jgi:hypothetical protein
MHEKRTKQTANATKCKKGGRDEAKTRKVTKTVRGAYVILEYRHCGEQGIPAYEKKELRHYETWERHDMDSEKKRPHRYVGFIGTLHGDFHHRLGSARLRGRRG